MYIRISSADDISKLRKGDIIFQTPARKYKIRSITGERVMAALANGGEDNLLKILSVSTLTSEVWFVQRPSTDVVNV